MRSIEYALIIASSLDFCPAGNSAFNGFSQLPFLTLLSLFFGKKLLHVCMFGKTRPLSSKKDAGVPKRCRCMSGFAPNHTFRLLCATAAANSVQAVLNGVVH